MQRAEKSCQTETELLKPRTADASVSTDPPRPTNGGPQRAARSNVSAASSKFSLLNYASPIPRLRQDVLDRLPKFNVTLPRNCHEVFFTRDLLTKVIGGAIQPLMVKFVLLLSLDFVVLSPLMSLSSYYRVTESASDVARKWGINGYMCPNMEHNPWSPTGPGKHGYMQVGIGQKKHTFVEPEDHHVFVGVGGVRKYVYCGKYRMSRVDHLNREEWHTLPEKVSQESIMIILESDDSDALFFPLFCMF